MSRPSVGGTFETKLGAAVTQPGYLLEIEFSTTVRWSTRGTLTWNSQTWTGREFKVQMSGGRGMDARLTLTLNNHDNAIGTLCLADGVGNRNIRLWTFTGNAPGLTDCSQIFGGIGDTFSLTKRRVTIQAVPQRDGGHQRAVLAHRAERGACRTHASRYAGSVERRNLHPAELSMATYPSLKQTYESDRQRLDGIATDEGGDGSLWVRQMYPADKYVFTVAHVVNASEKKHAGGVLFSQQGAAVRLRFRDELTTTYTGCVFVKSPQYKLISRGIWRVTAQIRQQ